MKVVQVDVIRIDVHLFHVQRLDFEKQENVEDQERDVGDNNKRILLTALRYYQKILMTMSGQLLAVIIFIQIRI